MKNLFNRTLSILCAVMLLISVFSVWAAAEEPATATDLNPAEEEQVMPENPAIPEESGEDPEAEPTQGPEAEPAQEPAEEPEEEAGEESIGSVEVVITKTLTPGQDWKGTVSGSKPAVLKLDLKNPGSVYILVEGKGLWATAEKSDRLTENPSRTQTDPETGRTVLSLQAEAGSYLITLGPVNTDSQAEAKVTVMGKKAYEAWEEEQAATEPEAEEEEAESEPAEEETVTEPEATEEETEPEPEAEPAEEETVTEPEAEPEATEKENEPEEKTNPEEETAESNPAEEATEPEASDEITEPETVESEDNEETKPEEETADEENVAEEEYKPEPEEKPERHISVEVTWDVPNPIIGDTAHFKASLNGYDGLVYTTQWQFSPDNKTTWYDVLDETETTMDVVVTKENNLYYWRILVYIEEDQME